MIQTRKLDYRDHCHENSARCHRPIHCWYCAGHSPYHHLPDQPGDHYRSIRLQRKRNTHPASHPQTNAAACSSFSGSANFTPKTNLGYAGDGVLNGSNPSAFQGGAFITASQLQDLHGDGSANDPGWIMLGQYNMGNGNCGNFIPSAIDPEQSSNIAQMGFFSATEAHRKGKDSGNGLGHGTWSFTPDAQVAQRAAAILGANWFDQMALAFKLGNDYVAYDFTTAQFRQTLTSSSPIMQWSGTYDVSTFQKGSDFSQITFWIRDPAGLSNVSAAPEPASMALVGLGMLGICATRYCRRKA